jgi:hypothetical protein
MTDQVTRYWTQDDLALGDLGNDPGRFPAGTASGVLECWLLFSNEEPEFFKQLSEDNSGCYHRAFDVRAAAAHWLKDTGEQKELREAMHRSGATGFTFRLRPYTDWLRREVRALASASRMITRGASG